MNNLQAKIVLELTYQSPAHSGGKSGRTEEKVSMWAGSGDGDRDRDGGGEDEIGEEDGARGSTERYCTILM